tara:strand:+ start:801 stop:1073 length:273 start_codon:yes stop_codon:yes gene_type:complete
MKLSRNTYIALFLILCVIYYYVNKYNFVENFHVEEINVSNHPHLRTDYNNLQEVNESTIHKNLLYNKNDIIKNEYNQPTSRTTGMFTKIN